MTGTPVTPPLSGEAVVWHDIECGAYTADLPLWRRLAGEPSADHPVLDVGAGTGRVTLELARHGHRVWALDRDEALLGALRERAQRESLSVRTHVADARRFSLPERFGLVIVPMQMIQLLAGPSERRQFLDCARAQLLSDGTLALAIAERLEPFEVAPGSPGPLPDMRESGGVLYASVPVAVRALDDGFLLARRRERTSPSGEWSMQADTIILADLSAEELEAELRGAGLSIAPRLRIGATADHVGSTVVIARAG